MGVCAVSNMKLYRVTFTTALLVEAESDYEAKRVGVECLVDEVRNGTSEVYSTELLEGEWNLRRGERGSLPWRSWRRWDEPEITVEEVLKNVSPR